ncbi:NAD(P)H-hydrate dehydratase [Donghicola sp. XS_ASV15]|uniref:NAD(P)H-hydrate dehydratase n=1 Tax=Donghicola sp. XS_ASV15 TaxID=3241295 RepID=UPI003512E560
MGEILTSAQMRAKEKRAIQAGLVSGLELMERAGTAVVEVTISAIDGLDNCNQTAVVLCGPGNNGGDGFVIARVLQERGWRVEVFFWGSVDRLPQDARTMHDRWESIGEIRPMSLAEVQKGSRPTLLFDAMFGIGINRPIPVDCRRAYEAICKRPPAQESESAFYRIAVDCPSGFDADSGVFLVAEGDNPTPEPQVDLCVTFHLPKVGHYLNEIAGTVPAVADIGLPYDVSAGKTRLIDPTDGAAREWLQDLCGLGAGGHKYDRGHVLLIGGGAGKGGAARLAARSALRVGAGLVTLAVPPEALAENAAQLNAVMLREVADAAALADILRDRRLSSICLGPGLGVGAQTREMVLTVLQVTAESGRRVVLDADALSSFADAPEDLFTACHDGVVITPHEGEFARLFPDLAEKARHSSASSRGIGKVEAVQRAAERLGASVLLKGAATVLANPLGQSRLHAALYDRSAPWLGTAGAGDVLVGLIAGLSASRRAQDSAPIDLAAAAAWLHVEAARMFGPGLIAEDLPEQLPAVFRKLGF